MCKFTFNRGRYVKMRRVNRHLIFVFLFLVFLYLDTLTKDENKIKSDFNSIMFFINMFLKIVFDNETCLNA